MEHKQPAVYILANHKNGTIYTGVTSDLIKRVYEHKNNIKSKFASKHNCNKLVFYALFDDIRGAITEEKRIKGGNRRKKIMMIESKNPEWEDLYYRIIV